MYIIQYLLSLFSRSKDPFRDAPAWANFIATNRNGKTFLYKSKPVYCTSGVWRSKFQSLIVTQKGCEKSVTKVKGGYTAVDDDGRKFLFSERPEYDKGVFFSPGGTYQLLDNPLWEESLIQRVKK